MFSAKSFKAESVFLNKFHFDRRRYIVRGTVVAMRRDLLSFLSRGLYILQLAVMSRSGRASGQERVSLRKRRPQMRTRRSDGKVLVKL